MPDIPAARLADLERIAEAATTWLRCWELAQGTSKTLTAFESSKRLAAVVRSVNGADVTT
jgi:hypothetical protein